MTAQFGTLPVYLGCVLGLGFGLGFGASIQSCEDRGEMARSQAAVERAIVLIAECSALLKRAEVECRGAP